jgi:hypothetical protein
MSLMTNLQLRENARTAQRVSLGGVLASQTLAALSDEFSRRILVSTVSRGMTVQEISVEQAVPLSTCYRRTRELVDHGLLVVERIVVTSEGKRYAVFRSSFRSVEISSDLSEMSLSAELNEDVAGKFRQKMFCLATSQ